MDNSQSNLPKLKVFQSIQKNFALMGISPKLVAQSYPFNVRIFAYFLSVMSGITLTCVYIFTDAKTVSEYMQTIYVASAGIFDVFTLLILILKVDQLFEFINRLDNVVNMSKCTLNAKIVLSNSIHLTIILPGVSV